MGVNLYVVAVLAGAALLFVFRLVEQPVRARAFVKLAKRLGPGWTYEAHDHTVDERFKQFELFQHGSGREATHSIRGPDAWAGDFDSHAMVMR